MWWIPTENDGTSNKQIALSNQSVAQYKGSVSALFDFNGSASKISQDFLIMLSSSEDNGVKFNTDDEDQLAKKIERFQNMINENSDNDLGEWACDQAMYKCTMKYITMELNGPPPKKFIRMNGKLQYIIAHNSSSPQTLIIAREFVYTSN